MGSQVLVTGYRRKAGQLLLRQTAEEMSCLERPQAGALLQTAHVPEPSSTKTAESNVTAKSCHVMLHE